MRIHYRTLYVPTVDLRTSKMKQRNTNCIPIDEITHTIHSVYIHNCKAELSSTVSLVYTQIQCSVSGTSKTKFFVADINIKCNGVHCMRAAGENFWKYIAYAYLHRHTRITWNRTSYAYVCWKHHVYTGNMFCVRKATMCNYLYRVSADA